MTEESKTTSDPEKATALKDLGNKELAAGHFTQAIDYYSQGLEFDDSNAILYSNRALVYIKIENYGLALTDAEAALKLDPSYAKAYYRRASANLALDHYKQARKDLRQVCKLKPKDRDARSKLAACEKAIKEQAFAAAIQAEHAQPLSETYQPKDVPIADSYKGPRLDTADNDEDEAALFEPGKLPRQFVLDCVAWQRDQNQVHKRHVAYALLACKRLMESTPSLMRIGIPNEGPGEEEKTMELNQDDKEYNTNSNAATAHKPRLTVCGDTHGQFYDLLHIFESVNGGYPKANNPYVFNGDFVDRGSFSVEVILTLLLFKLNDPHSVYLTRGNHETKNMNKIYGFEGEVRAKYDDKIFQLFLEVFEWLPLAAVIQDAVFVTHGGLPSHNYDPQPPASLADITKIPRGMEPPESGLMSDLLWSDPQPFPGKSPSKRGVGFSFGPDITEAFLKANNLQLLVRSHEVKDEGYLVEHGGKTITVFSAPNYCDTMGNKGALLRFFKKDEGDDDDDNNKSSLVLPPEFVQYQAVPHPNVKPMQYAAGMGGLFQ